MAGRTDPDGTLLLEQFYRELIEAAPDAVLVGEVGASHYLLANAAAERLLGYNGAALTQLGLTELLAPDEPLGPAEIQQLCTGNASWRGELRLRHRDGRPVPVEATSSRHTAGGRALYQLVLRDITERQAADRERDRLLELAQAELAERHRTEAELRETEARFRQFAEQVDQVFWMTDPAKAEMLYISPAYDRIWGRSATSLLAEPRSWLAAIHPDDRQAVLQAALTRQVSGEYDETYRIIRPDGTVRWIHDRAFPVHDASGQVYRVLGVATDVTREKLADADLRESKHRLESALEALERTQAQVVQQERLRALGQMASGIAHDLNQSLALVAGYGDLARRALATDPPDLAALFQVLPVLTRAAMDGGETVKRLLVFARGRRDGPAETVELGALLREVAQLTAPRWRDLAQAEGRPITLTVEADEAIPVTAWPAALRDALTNLIFNAVDALPAGGTIRLAARRRDGAVDLEVADSGTGMPAEVQARIFEPFFTTKGERGSGLGLSQVFGIVEQHGGQIQVQSTPGRGTCFCLRLRAPASAEHQLEPAPAPTRATSPASARPLRILAVDDEPALAKMVELMLGWQGHAISLANSGEAAVARLANEQFDLVISDLGLGTGMSGWELADQVRARWPGTRLVLATGWAAEIDPAEAAQRGVEAVIAKPYRLVDLQRIANRDPA
jgi:PAS domain S-box-containing protein